MESSETPKNPSLIEQIADGSIGGTQRDKGGNWSKQYGLWVDQKIRGYLDDSPNQREIVERLGEVGLSVGKLFALQMEDTDNGKMYPSDLDARTFLEAARTNPSAGDPYSLLPNLHDPAIPYSHAYREPLSQLRESLTNLSLNPDLDEYTKALLHAYSFDPERTSDLTAFHDVDATWVNIPSDTKLLFFAEPTEPYYDPLRAKLGQDPNVVQWAKDVTRNNQLGPWRNFFEFRLLIQEPSVISDEDIQTIRETSRSLFSRTSDVNPPVSLEFRRLLIASGNGAFPAKVAKNYPNFNDIRDTIGYKNIVYTNMVEQGVVTQFVPTIEEFFGDTALKEFDIHQLTRSSALGIVAHEENHPFQRHEGNTVFEELKASINGTTALIKSGKFSERDLHALYLGMIYGSLFRRKQVLKARSEGDEKTERGIEAYYKGSTILLNFLTENGAFLTTDGRVTDIDYSKFEKGIISLSSQLEAVRQGSVPVSEINSNYGNEDVWHQFKSRSQT